MKDRKEIIEIKNLNKWYGDFHVLKDINLTINKGEIIVQGTMAEVLAMHDEKDAPKDGYRGGKLEEIFLKLTQS